MEQMSNVSREIKQLKQSWASEDESADTVHTVNWLGESLFMLLQYRQKQCKKTRRSLYGVMEKGEKVPEEKWDAANDSQCYLAKL